VFAIVGCSFTTYAELFPVVRGVRSELPTTKRRTRYSFFTAAVLLAVPLGVESRTLNRLLVPFGMLLFIRPNSLTGATVVACRFDGRAWENVVVNIPAVVGFAAFLPATRI
jgi:hypothetical protein